MSDMKCPFCNSKLLDVSLDYDWKCEKCSLAADLEVWQELIRIKELLDIESAEHSMCHTQMLKTTEKLERTRKALDVAVDALKRLEKELYFNNAKQTGHIADSVMSIPSTALEQITALEQKDEQ